MLHLENDQVVMLTVSTHVSGEDRVVITLTPENYVLTLTAHQARQLSTQLIQAVQRIEVKTNLRQPGHALRRKAVTAFTDIHDAALAK